MTYTIEIKRSAEKELAKLPKSIAVKVIARIKALADDPTPNGCKKLTGTQNTYRIRISRYRVVYSIIERKLLIQVIRIGHRAGIYKR